MPDALESYLRHTLPEELYDALESRLLELEQGEFEKLLSHQWSKRLLGLGNDGPSSSASVSNWSSDISKRLQDILNEEPTSRTELHHFFLLVAIAALQAFVQSNVTGPPLSFSIPSLLFPSSVHNDQSCVRRVRQTLVSSLTTDGEAAYKLTPNVELIVLAKCILSNTSILQDAKAASWAKLRVDFMHQRLLSEVAPTLQKSIYQDLDIVDELLQGLQSSGLREELYSQFLLEVAAIHTHHGLDKQAREILDQAAKSRKFEFAITGLLGKRTRYQERDTSQLVVLARSADTANGTTTLSNGHDKDNSTRPETLNLNDDTLLEAISFTEKPPQNGTDVVDNDSLPEALSSLDPGDQPLLHPLDSTILLSLASSITNTSPSDGLTREETLPYATRVLDGGSSNWQVYTQALLVRSRIEGYRSRTVERGLLQLQAVVDQVIAETTSADGTTSATNGNNASTFLPRAKEAESAPVTERLQYIYPLCSPTRWELEAELASRWVSLGGLRSALDIYERLEMWAEAALCWAATEREDKARKIVRRQLFHATSGNDEDVGLDEDNWEGPARDPPPADAPRLYCIMGDLDNDVSMWEKAWDVSNGRYARAQRTLGRHYIQARDYVKAADAYSKSLKITQLNQQSWFALGCCLLELCEFDRAVEAFSRTVQLDDTDAEAWSNLAAALLRKESPEPSASQPVFSAEDEEKDSAAVSTKKVNPQQNHIDALSALKRAATLKHDSARIWDNLLTVSATLSPPSYTDIVVATKRLIELRGPSEGEKSLDVTILELLVRHVTASEPSLGLPRMVLELFDTSVVPLITTEPRLWRLVSVLALWRGAPGQALDATEKGWRAIIAQPGWELESEAQWNKVVEATVDLADAYENLGTRTREGSEAVVAKDWRFKARSAVRGIMGRGKDSWEGTEGWERLKECLDGLKGSA